METSLIASLFEVRTGAVDSEMDLVNRNRRYESSIRIDMLETVVGTCNRQVRYCYAHGKGVLMIRRSYIPPLPLPLCSPQDNPL